MAELNPTISDEQVIEHRRTRDRHASTVGGGGRISLNLTAMIDVTFLLLIYFLVATEFKLGEEIYRLDLPERMPAELDRDPFELDEEPLRIEVITTGIAPRACTLRIDGPYPQPASFDALAHFLIQQRISEATPSGLFQPDHPVIVRPAALTRWDHTIETFNTVVKAGYINVTFARPG